METLPQDLKSLVRSSVDILGHEIQKVFGNKIFQLVESLRQELKHTEHDETFDKFKLFNKSLRKLEKLSNEDHLILTHCYGVYLELINRVETAYRHYRLAQKQNESITDSPYAIIYVFTAHPTEARSPKLMNFFNKIEKILIAKLSGINNQVEDELRFCLNLILRTSMASKNKPTVEDEARHIYNIVLDQEILQLQTSLLDRGITVYFRSWVGGDKDGHPFVNHQTMKNSLQLSRDHILNFITEAFLQHNNYLKNIDQPNASLQKLASEINRALATLKEVKKNDGLRVAKFKKAFKDYYQLYKKYFDHESPYLKKIKNTIWIYPAIVLPLEIREDSELVHKAIKDPKLEISKMLHFLQEVSNGEKSKWYVRGFILSMCEEAEDYLAGIELTEKRLKNLNIPVVPLFETQKALANAPGILNKVFELRPEIKTHHQNLWESRFEVMLGYSDSSKENGIFTGKWLIAKAIHEVDQFLIDQKLTPVFFHGSGGSVARGGGSLKEQIQWWPQSALNIYKVTIQGEMVSRQFGDPLILESQIQKITKELGRVKVRKPSKEFHQAMDLMAQKSKSRYQSLFSDDLFIKAIKLATPYQYLDELKIGSRPSKRQKTTSNELKLRAIPWILCWTQTRGLLPNWYGIGDAWMNLDSRNKKIIQDSYKDSDYLKSFINSLGFSLAKVELEIFKLYLNEFLTKSEAEQIYLLIETEFLRANTFFNEVSGQSNLLFFRAWLEESIHLRSRMIHPINMLQIIALKKHNYQLLRETVTAIACGMMTTG